MNKKYGSFAQWGINNLDENFLEKYLDYNKNDELGINPFTIPTRSLKKVFIICQDNKYHGSYLVSTANFTGRNSRCPYCSGRKVHPLDSLGQYIVDNFGEDFLWKAWSNKNEKSPFEFTQKSNKSVWWRCPEGKHKDFKRIICDSNTCEFKCPKCSNRLRKSDDEFNKEVFDLVGNEYTFLGEYINNKTKIPIRHEECNHVYNVTPDRFLQGSRCPQCSKSKGEKAIIKWLEEHSYNYIPQKEFDGLIGLGNGQLSYDFYLPDLNLLIEYQGQFHDGTSKHQTDEEFKKQQEHDRRKNGYAKEHSIRLLEIWYWDFDRIEEILSKNLKIN